MIQGILNATIAEAGDCRAEKRRASDLMETVAKPNLKNLALHHLVAVPFPEHELLNYLSNIWHRWNNKIRNGLIVFEDNTLGNAEEPRPLLRFSNESRVSFQDEVMFRNGIFNGRYFIWIDFPTAFMTIDFFDFTSFGCSQNDIVPVFGRSLSEMVGQFSSYASRLPDDEEPEYRREIAVLYGSQWALANPTAGGAVT